MSLSLFLSLSRSLFFSFSLSFCISLCLYPSADYMSYFEKRDLRAFSVDPLLLYPTHYTGDPGYLSDTETSTIWDDEAVSTDWDRQYPAKRAQAQAQQSQGQAQASAHMQPSMSADSPAPAPHAGSASRDEL